ncbi:hypothetical protein J4Q44_G00390730 [Coregonus suidteri]|uniref:Uncharacterized protein n=1 Tax=Coregonus suidteri TaxID=861788 RepID=A0AAN8K8D4_9TELE
MEGGGGAIQDELRPFQLVQTDHFLHELLKSSVINTVDIPKTKSTTGTLDQSPSRCLL